MRKSNNKRGRRGEGEGGGTSRLGPMIGGKVQHADIEDLEKTSILWELVR